jgi:excisionase family DNA binding protein
MATPKENATIQPPLLLRVEDAARMLSVSKSHLWGLIWGGQIPHVKLGRAVRVPQRALEEWISDNSSACAPCKHGA